MLSGLSRASRRLSGSLRGLGDALADPSTACPGNRLAALRSLTASTARPPQPAEDPAARSGSSPGTQHPASAQPDSSARAGASPAGPADAAAGGSAAAAAAALPPGHIDFQQRQLLMVFTCSKCNTRAAKAFSKQSYEHGVVIVDCPGCQAKHLIADHLGWFGRKGTVEEFAAQRGNTVLRRLADGTVELSPAEVLGPGLAGEAAAAATGGMARGAGVQQADAGGLA